MCDAFETTIDRALQLEGEAPFLDSLVDNPSDAGCKRVYADWLEEQGDSARSAFLLHYAAAFESMKVDEFPSFDDVPEAWAHVIGARLSRSIAEQQLGEHRDAWLKLAKPALKYKTDYMEDNEDFGGDKTPKGVTKLFGVPDLPPGSAWPKQKDCNSFYDSDSGIAPESNCGFVCQINLADFAGTQAARLFPNKGLISIFACAEIESIGMVDAYVAFTPDPTDLVRLDPPEDLFEDEANQVLDPYAFRMLEMLELPSAGEVSPFESIKWGYNHDLYDRYHSVLENAEIDQLSSFLGYTRPTTGDDPLPGADYCKLICVPNTIGMILHFCIRNDDLAAGRFDRVVLAWVDFD